jgi:hypothetical protein
MGANTLPLADPNEDQHWTEPTLSGVAEMGSVYMITARKVFNTEILGVSLYLEGNLTHHRDHIACPYVTTKTDCQYVGPAHLA